MKKRNPIVVFLLSIVTFGIYDIYWLVSTKKVLNQKTKQHVPTIWLIVGPIILLIVGYILFFAGAGSIKSQSGVYNQQYGPTTITPNQVVTHSPIFFVGLGIIFIGYILTMILGLIWIFKYSKAVNEYTNGKMSTAISFLILWLIHLIGVAIIQDTFNEIEDGGVAQATGPVTNNPVQAGAAQSIYPQPTAAEPYTPPQSVNPQPGPQPVNPPVQNQPPVSQSGPQDNKLIQ